MKVRNFILADAASGEGLFFLHGAGISTIAVQGFPYAHPRISVFVTLVVGEDDKPGNRELVIALTERDGKPVDRILTGTLELPSIGPGTTGAGTPAPIAVINIVAHKVGLRAAREGLHWVALEVDGEQLDRLSLRFMQLSQGATA